MAGRNRVNANGFSEARIRVWVIGQIERKRREAYEQQLAEEAQSTLCQRIDCPGYMTHAGHVQ